MDVKRNITDPIERIVGDALDRASIAYTHDSEGARLDFLLTVAGIYIECKQFPTPRTERQIAPYANVIVIQGRKAADWFADVIDQAVERRT